MAASAPAVRTSGPQPQTMSLARRRAITGLLFLSPWFVGLIAFQLLPIVATIFLSFTNYNASRAFAFDAFEYVGFANYGRLFTDPVLFEALGVTVRYVLFAVPIGLLVPLGFAVLVNSKHLLAPSVFRTLFFMPSVIPLVASTMIFQGVLNSESGWINRGLNAIFGIEGPRWFGDPAWVLPAITLLGLWGVGGTMIVLLAGLQGVPTELLEAATIDGANGLQRFWKVTIPMISPVLFYNLTLGTIGAFQFFAVAFLIGGRNGDPQGATMFYNLHFYRTAFVFNEMGYGSVLALMLFILVMILTAIMFYFGQRGVYYAGGES